MQKLNIALLSGGISSEREVSLRSGQEVFEALDKNKYNIFRYDPKTDLAKLVSDADNLDVALLILHGPYGEDGTIQGMLDLIGLPYQGSGVLGSALAMNKLSSKKLYEKAGLPVPSYIVLHKNKPVDLIDIKDRIGFPFMMKPAQGGSSIGMSLVKSEADFNAACERAFAEDSTVLVESYIKGIEITGAVIGNDELLALPLVEITPDKNHTFFDYHAKYTPGATSEICPARISESLSQKAQDYAKRAHQALFLKGYSRTDMILKGDEILILETNTIPGMTRTSLLPLAAKTAGIPFSGLLDKLIGLCLEKV